MEIKVLLLNSTYEVLSWVPFKKAIKLIIKEKVDIISTWKQFHIKFGQKIIEFPATLKLRYFIKKNFSKMVFSRKAVFRRDKCSCQYCGCILKNNQMTIDHIIPISLGGETSFFNCVAACLSCNSKKGSKTLDQINMRLINEPTIPAGYLYSIPEIDFWHQDWKNFVR